MKDTPPAIEQKFRQMLLKRSGQERLKMGCSMHATARALAKSALLQKHPKARPAELKRLLFLHFYGNDFKPEQRDRIATFLAERGGRNKMTQARFRRTLQPVAAKSSMRVAEPPGRYGTKRPAKRNK